MTHQSINLNGTIKRAQPRYINLDEDIYEALDIYSLKVYLALRYEADYSKECSSVKKSVAHLMESSKVKRNQFFICLNKLESLGLIKREDSLGQITNYLVARTLHYFHGSIPTVDRGVRDTDRGVRDTDRGVRDTDRGVRDTDTDQESFQQSLQKDNSESKDSPPTTPVNKEKDIQEFIDVWNDIAVKNGNPKQGQEKRSLAELRRNLKTIEQEWEVKLTPKSFRKWIDNAILAEFYFFHKDDFKKSMAICTRWRHFEEAYNLVMNKVKKQKGTE